MNEAIRVIGNKLLLSFPPASDLKAGNISLPRSSYDQLWQGRIEAVGNGVDPKHNFAAGEKVMVQPGMGVKRDIDGTPHWFVSPDMILCVIPEYELQTAPAPQIVRGGGIPGN